MNEVTLSLRGQGDLVYEHDRDLEIRYAPLIARYALTTSRDILCPPGWNHTDWCE